MSEEDDPEIEKSPEYFRKELEKTSPSKRKRIYEKFALAALGSIPWVGGFISAAASLKTEEGGIRQDSLQTQWLEEHAAKIKRLGATLDEIAQRFENFGERVDERIQSPEYLQLVRKAFRTWDQADTDEKREYARNLVANSAGARLCPDDVVRLFIDWLDVYHEVHFAVIREIFQHPNITRAEIWSNIHGEIVREDSAEADLFRLLIRDLSTGGVIRQTRETTHSGEFVKRSTRGRPRRSSQTMESAFEDTKPYVLTELGRQFVHYTMSDVVERIEEQ